MAIETATPFDVFFESDSRDFRTTLRFFSHSTQMVMPAVASADYSVSIELL